MTETDVLNEASRLLTEQGWCPAHKEGRGLHVLQALFRACINLGPVASQTQRSAADRLLEAAPSPTEGDTVTDVETTQMQSAQDVEAWLTRAINDTRACTSHQHVESVRP